MLKWEDILWDQGKILVHAPKTERYEGKAFRKIPFFPHVEDCLLEAAEQAEEGSIYVVEKHAPLYMRGQKERVYLSRQGNLGTMFKKIMHRAGIVPWPKLIQNLRASFETDLLNKKYGEFGIHVIAEWLGHSVRVMLEHYGRIQQADYDKIALASQEVKKRKKRVAQKAAQHTAAEGENERHVEEVTFLPDLTQPIEFTALSGKEGTVEASSRKPPKPVQWAVQDSVTPLLHP